MDVPVSVYVVVERQFLVLPYRPIRKDAHPDTLAYLPFGNITVWFTTVVRETANATSFGRINVLGHAEASGSVGCKERKRQCLPRLFAAS